jgi:hypothetical protein
LVAGENRKEDDLNDHRTIVGVTTVFQNTRIYGQLIVDASGRNSETPNWLEKLDFERPPETRVNSYIGYATRQFRPRPKNNHANWKVMIILTQPPDNPVHLCCIGILYLFLGYIVLYRYGIGMLVYRQIRLMYFSKKTSTEGGKAVQPKMAIPGGIGYLAICEDTEGNSFGIIQEKG